MNRRKDGHGSSVQAFSFRRVSGLLLRHLYVLRRSWPRLLDLAYWPTIQMILWGFVTLFFVQHSSWVAQAAGVLISAVLLWDILFRANLGVSLSFMEEMWARNLAQLFASPLRPYELVVALALMSLIRTVIGLIVSALVLRLGLGAEGLAWVAIFALGPLSGVYYPISTLPAWLQPVAWVLPPAWVFEGMRAVLFEGAVRTDNLVIAAGLNLLYMAAAAGFFLWTCKVARIRGLLIQQGE